MVYFFGTIGFADSLKSRFLKESHPELPQQRLLLGKHEPEKLVTDLSDALGCDIAFFREGEFLMKTRSCIIVSFLIMTIFCFFINTAFCARFFADMVETGPKGTTVDSKIIVQDNVKDCKRNFALLNSVYDL